MDMKDEIAVSVKNAYKSFGKLSNNQSFVLKNLEMTVTEGSM